MKFHEMVRPQFIVALYLLSSVLGLFPETSKADDLEPRDVLPLVVFVEDMPVDYTNTGPLNISGSTNSARVSFRKGTTQAKIAVEISRNKVSVAFFESKMGSIVEYHTEDADMVFSRNLGLGERSFHRGSKSIIQPDSNSKYVSQDISIFWQEWSISVSITHYIRFGQTRQQDFTDHEAGQLLRSLARKIYPRFLKVVRDGSTDSFTSNSADTELEGKKTRAQWCREERKKPMKKTMRDGYIGVLVAATGDVEVDPCTGNVAPSTRGTLIQLGDCIRTGSLGLTRVQLADHDESRSGMPSVINIASNSEVCFDNFLGNFDVKPGDRERRNNQGEISIIVDLIRGKVREFFKGWGRNSSVSVKTGSTICGSRGTDFVVAYDPTTKLTSAFITDGELDVSDLETNDKVTLTAGQKVIIKKGDIGPVQSLLQAEYSGLVSQNGLDYVDPDQESCTQNFPGTFPTGKNAEGRLVCECPNAVIWDSKTGSCPAQKTQLSATDQESCSQNFPGTLPTGRNAEGRLVCECPDGVIWDKTTGYCPQQPVSTIENQSSSFGIQPLFVTKAMSVHSESPGGSEYDKVSASVFIDPSITNWVAWNDTSDVAKGDHTLTGTFLWGGGGFGTDDFIRLTVTAPDGQTAVVDMDKNNANGAHRQGDAMNVIFNPTGQAPKTLRIDAFGDTAGKRVVFDEVGAFNQLFQKPGIYTFDFSFRNQFTKDAGHGDVYLLISSK